MLRWTPLAACLSLPLAAWAQAGDPDPLSLQSAPVAPAAVKESPVRAYVEVAGGRADQRYGLPSVSLRRASFDFSATAKLSDSWRFGLSDRIDNTHPVSAGEEKTVNSLREIYANWRSGDSSHVVDLGRVNLRLGPAYGYSPTDFFRDGAQRIVTSDDPFALRENRLGTAMVRYQRLWQGGSASVALAPKLADEPNRSSFNPDFGSTNHSSRVLATLSRNLSDRTSGQLLLFIEEDKGAQVGVNGTALIGDAAVAHVEWTHGRDVPLAVNALPGTPGRDTRSRFSAGVTYTAPTRTAITAEIEYNGFGLSRSDWNALGARGAAAIARLLVDSQLRQDLASRRAWMIYATQKDAGVKNLDFTAFVRSNVDDKSRLAWLEGRYHFPKVDVAVQWRSTHGPVNSGFGFSPQRSALQALAAWYF